MGACCPGNSSNTKYTKTEITDPNPNQTTANINNNNHDNNNHHPNITIQHNHLPPRTPVQQTRSGLSLVTSPQPIMSISQYSAHHNHYSNMIEGGGAVGMSQSMYVPQKQNGTMDSKYSTLSPLDCQSYQFMDFPFLINDSVIHWIKATKMLFIMRGPSGSGKTTIVSCIIEKFPNAHVCSADFYSSDSVSDTNITSTRIPHPSGTSSPKDTWLQNQIYQAFESGKNPIIIDEPHIRCWEYKYSVDLAIRFDYLVQVVLPKTPWRFDSDRLVERSSRQAPPWDLERAVKQFEPALPLYFGWFLGDTDSDRILQFATDTLEMMINIQEIRIGLASACDLPEFVSKEDLIDHWTVKPDRLHVTTKFCGYGTVGDGESYLRSGIVQESLGQLFQVHIRGLLLTPRTFSGHIQLGGPRQIQLWAGDDQEEAGDGVGGTSSKPSSLSKKTGALAARLSLGGSGGSKSGRRPFGCRAHITLMFAEGTRPVQSGLDQLQVIDAQLKQQNGKIIAQVPAGTIIDWDKGRYYLELFQPIVCQALFTGQY